MDNNQVAYFNIGGTNPTAEYDGKLFALKTADYNSFSELVLAFFELFGTSVERAVFAVACPANGDTLSFANARHFNCTKAEVLAATRIINAIWLNDFEAGGHGVRILQPADIEQIAPSPTEFLWGEKRFALIGSGSGLGHCIGQGTRVINTEGGHTRYGMDLSYERKLSGSGLLDSYNGISSSVETAERVAELASHGDIAARHAVRMFHVFLAAYIQAVILLGQVDEVYISGFLPNWLEMGLFDKDELFKNLYGKADNPNTKNMLHHAGIYIVKHPELELLGCKAVAQQHFAS